MGYYINPTDGLTKEEWLIKHGKEVTLGMAKSALNGASFFPVCLVDNFEFTAAGIAYDEMEFNCFNHPDDYRPKKWYIVPRENLIEWYT